MAQLTATNQEFAQLVRAFTPLDADALGIKLPGGQGAVRIARLALEGEATWKNLAFDYRLTAEPDEDLKLVLRLR